MFIGNAHLEVYIDGATSDFYSTMKTRMWEYQLRVFREYGGLNLRPFGYYLQYPFTHPFTFHPEGFPEELKWFYWYIMHLYTIAIQLPTDRVRHILHWSSWIRGEHPMKHFVEMMESFKPLNT